jgi:hypothetical protein
MTLGKWVGQRTASAISPDDPIEGFVVLTFKFQRIDRTTWFGECLELGTATNARTLNRPHDERTELVILHLNSLEEAGERAQFFRDNRIAFHKPGKHLTAVSLQVPIGNDDVFFHPQTVPLTRAA